MIDLTGLNEAQYAAVTSDAKNILCLAGAGTGKTRVLTHRVARLRDDGISCENMLALTFTRLAGVEMKERVIHLIGAEEGRQLFCNTFHAFCVEVLQEHGSKLGYIVDFSIYGPEDQETLVKEILRDFGYKSLSMKRALSALSSDFPKGTKEHSIRLEYFSRLLQRNAVDFDSLIAFTTKLFTNFPCITDTYRSQYPYVFIDEFQDTSDDQWALVTLLCPENLFIVGDDFQSIYGWRNANIQIILALAKDPAYEVIKLEENYRSTIPIVLAANTLIRKNTQTEKALRTNREGSYVCVDAFDIEEQEYAAVRAKIEKLTAAGRCAYRDIAVLARTNRQLDAAAEVLVGIPHLVVNTVTDPLKANDIRMIFSYMEAARNESDDTLIKKIINFPKPILSDRDMLLAEKDQLERGGSFMEALADIPGANPFLKRLNYFKEFVYRFHDDPLFVFDALAKHFKLPGADDTNQDAWASSRSESASPILTAPAERPACWRDSVANLIAAREAIARWTDKRQLLGEPTDVTAFLNWLRLRDMTDKLTDDRDAVRLMTVHASKGLEFEAVFVVGMNEGSFPSRGDIEEERRLFYVAITRAKTHLFISRAKTVKDWGGKPAAAAESRFIQEMQ